MTFPHTFLLGILLFLTGCTSLTTLEHQSFSMEVPSWNQQTLLTSQGITNGFSAFDSDCTFNLSLSIDTYLQAAQPIFERLRALGQNTISDYQLLDQLVFIEYALPNDFGGYIKILSCPSGFTYVVDYQCKLSALPQRQLEMLRMLNSMAC